MFGWINDCCESLIISKFGKEKWHEIKEKAGCTVKDGGFIRHQYYTDESSVELVLAISQVLSMPVKDVLEVFGQYFMEFTRHAGYDNLLSCQGSNLRLWLSNLNSLHEHLQDTLPRGRFPEFWCKDDPEVPGCILLYYLSERGDLFVPFVVGLVKEIARYHFDLDITMDVVQTQGEDDDAQYTIYRIGTVDASQIYRLTENQNSIFANEKSNEQKEWESMEYLHQTDGGDIRKAADLIPRCPFHEIHKSASGQQFMDDNAEKLWNRMGSSEASYIHQNVNKKVVCPQASDTLNNESGDTSTIVEKQNAKEQESRELGVVTNEAFISNEKMREIFPHHVVIDQNFTILQIGVSTQKLIGSTRNIVGKSIKNIFKIKRPKLADWEWSAILKYQEQSYFLQSNLAEKRASNLKAHLITLSENPRRALFVLAPDAKNIQQLTNMNLTMSDLPLHTFQRDAIFLGEHMYSGIRSAHKLDKISRKLAYEHNLSNSLLYSMFPKDVAHTLRNGNPYEPKHHENVTLFFSDVVGFTNLCAQLPPWDVVDMLNRLYTVMDFLADRFQLYKVETIGDAYLCCSGLPESNTLHAEYVANFAIAVRECVPLIKSPLTDEPIRLRIGIHTGSCMSGVVGTMTPRYCLFGDMVNTTSRHESTGEPGKIQCSSVTFERLTHFTIHPEHYNFTPRGLVEMKGKGKMFTYWLDGPGESNPFVGPSKLQSLRNEVQEMLNGKTWRKRTYFERRSTNSSFSSLVLPSFENEVTETEDDNSSSDEEEVHPTLHNDKESSVLKLQFYRNPTGALHGIVEDDDFSQQIRRQSFKQITTDEDSVISPVSGDALDSFDVTQGNPQKQHVSRNKAGSESEMNDTIAVQVSIPSLVSISSKQTKQGPTGIPAKLAINNKQQRHSNLRKSGDQVKVIIFRIEREIILLQANLTLYYPLIS